MRKGGGCLFARLYLARPGFEVDDAAKWLGVALLLAAALRLNGLDAAPLWTDELFTLFYPKAGIGFMWTEGLRLEPTSPLYYTLIAGVEHVMGESAWALRLPSVLGSLLTVWFVALLTRELWPRPMAPVIAAVLLALAPLEITYAQEARSYALQAATLAFASLSFARFLRQPQSTRALVGYAIAAALSVYLHMTSIVAAVAFNVTALLAAMWGEPRLDGRALRRWVLANAAATVACVPLLPILLSPVIASATSWMPNFSRWTLEAALGSALAGPAVGTHAMVAAEILVPLLAALLLLPPWRPGRRAVLVLAVVPGIFLVTMIASTALGRKVLLDRTLLWMLAPLAAALGDVLARRPKPLGGAILCFAALATGLHLARFDSVRENWPNILAALPGLRPPAMLVLAPHTSPAAIALYAPPGAPTPVRLDDGGAPVPESSVIPRVLGTEDGRCSGGYRGNQRRPPRLANPPPPGIRLGRATALSLTGAETGSAGQRREEPGHPRATLVEPGRGPFPSGPSCSMSAPAPAAARRSEANWTSTHQASASGASSTCSKTGCRRKGVC